MRYGWSSETTTSTFGDWAPATDAKHPNRAITPNTTNRLCFLIDS